MLDKKVAERVKAVSLACTQRLNFSVKDALGGAPEVHASMYRRLVGRTLGELFTEVLVPVYAAYPDLEPEELRKARVESQPAVIPLEVASKLTAAVSFAIQELNTLRTELIGSGKEIGNLDFAFQGVLETLQDILEFLFRVCPDLKRDGAVP